jgi:subfamily B ATP-binding cassette protein MsbA
MNFRFLLGCAWPYRSSLAFCAALMLAETAAALATPWLGGQFAQGVLEAGSTGVDAILLWLLALFAAQALIKFVSSYVLSRTSERILADLRIRLYDHLQALPLSFFHERRQGDILALLTYEVAHLSSFLTGTLLQALPLLLTAAGAIALMFRIDPALATGVTILIPCFYIVIKLVGRRLRPLGAQVQMAEATAIATAEQNLGMLPAIKLFTREELESERHKTDVLHARALSTAQQRHYAILEPTVQFLAAAAIVILLWFASSQIRDGSMAPAELVSFLLYAGLLTRPVSALANTYGQTQMARGYLEHLESVLTEMPEPIFFEGAPLPRLRGEISFRDVVFAYPGRPASVDGVNLNIAAGKTVALTGENGVGKSTLVHLLMRLHEPQSGQILVDGVDVSSVSLRDLRSQIGVVPQHVLLLNGSVRENIAFGKAGASFDEIEQAARLAQAHAFVSRLPQGYDTVIGDQGIRLSGGERQRIALARALIKNPPILVLDEATAMFDPEGEIAFIEDAKEALAGRTVILITHRPASLALADRVLRIMHGGRIQELIASEREGRGSEPFRQERDQNGGSGEQKSARM